jgi:hypothetical protein
VLGYPHPDVMLANMTSSQFAEWKAFSAIDPIGSEYRSEVRHAQLMRLLDAAHFKQDYPKKVSEFMNFLNETEEEPLNDDEYYDRLDREVFGV